MNAHRNRASGALTVGFVSLGCAKNLVDSQVMAGALLAHDFELAAAPEEADVVVVNTCAFIEAAREESVEHILAACRLKARGPCRAVVVAGCMTQRYREELRDSLPEVDAFLGLDELDRIGDVIDRVVRGEHGILSVSPRAQRLFDPGRSAVVFTGGPYAYLKIAEGCNHGCSFCAIPGIRGRHRSRSIARIVAEAEHLLAAGFRELNVISQDVTSYGRDLGDGTNLAGLIRRLGAIGGTFWIRLLYGYPSRITDELLGAMAEVEQVCPYLDVPIQHSHPDILRAMRRAGTTAAVRTMAARIRNALPGVAVRTTCLLGFPGERETHFRHLLSFVKETEFDHLGAFAYSPEADTTAVGMPHRPRAATAERRRGELLLAQRAIVGRRAAARRGQEAIVLLERPLGEGGAWAGRSAHQAPDVDGEVHVSGVHPDRRVGDFIRVCYIGSADYDMTAVAVGSDAAPLAS